MNAGIPAMWKITLVKAQVIFKSVSDCLFVRIKIVLCKLGTAASNAFFFNFAAPNFWCCTRPIMQNVYKIVDCYLFTTEQMDARGYLKNCILTSRMGRQIIEVFVLGGPRKQLRNLWITMYSIYNIYNVFNL